MLARTPTDTRPPVNMPRLLTLPKIFALAAACVSLCAETARAAEVATDIAARFEKAALPFIAKHCLGCHGEKDPKAELSLFGDRNAKAVVSRRSVWEGVLEMVETGQMPPQNKPRPDPAEAEAFVALVNSLFEEVDRTAAPDPGRVTVRRLNRVEYNNTIRDLIGVDFDPAEDFPSDDIGYGFDNIGDVLTLSPVLMERYLAAAETIVERAIMPNPPKPTRRHVSARYAEPSGGGDKRFRAISTKPSDKPQETGPLHSRYQVPEDGEYIFRAKVYAEVEGDEPVQVAVLACGKNVEHGVSDEEAARISGLAVKALRPFAVVKTLDIKARSADKAEQIEVQVPPMRGLERMALAIVAPAEGKPPVTLHVEYFSLEGPLDMRPASHRRLLACDFTKPAAEQTREVLTRFVTRAYRRPAAPEEVDRLATLVDAVVAEGQPWEAGIQRAIEAVLVSPKFLFRLELDDRPDSADTHPIDEFQLASRLSYFLWSTLPDDELLALASRRELTANLDSQVRRMLASPKSKALVDNFVMQWLQLRRLKTVAPDGKLFPAFNERLRSAMFQETELFFGALLHDDRSVLEALDSDFTFLNEPLARHYGIADTLGNRSGQKVERPGGEPIRGPNFVRVALSDKQRGGLLTQASVLTVTSNPTRTSPVKRGRWVLEQMLGAPPPPPPPNVPELAEGEKAQLTGSLRQRMEQHRANPACANCHAKMDPIGFAFENYDAIGAFRQKDGDFPIETAGVLTDGKTFQGAAELKTILKERQTQFTRCLTEKLLTYALGRGLEHYDRRPVLKIQDALSRNDFKFSTLFVEIAKSDPFRLRRGNSHADTQ